MEIGIFPKMIEELSDYFEGAFQFRSVRHDGKINFSAYEDLRV